MPIVHFEGQGTCGLIVVPGVFRALLCQGEDGAVDVGLIGMRIGCHHLRDSLFEARHIARFLVEIGVLHPDIERPWGAFGGLCEQSCCCFFVAGQVGAFSFDVQGGAGVSLQDFVGQIGQGIGVFPGLGQAA